MGVLGVLVLLYLLLPGLEILELPGLERLEFNGILEVLVVLYFLLVKFKSLLSEKFLALLMARACILWAELQCSRTTTKFPFSELLRSRSWVQSLVPLAGEGGLVMHAR